MDALTFLLITLLGSAAITQALRPVIEWEPGSVRGALVKVFVFAVILYGGILSVVWMTVGLAPR